MGWSERAGAYIDNHVEVVLDNAVGVVVVGVGNARRVAAVNKRAHVAGGGGGRACSKQ